MGLICFAGGDTSKQGKSREIKGNRGIQGEIRNPGGNKGIFMVRESYVYEGMFMYGCVCFFG